MAVTIMAVSIVMVMVAMVVMVMMLVVGGDDGHDIDESVSGGDGRSDSNDVSGWWR